MSSEVIIGEEAAPVERRDSTLAIGLGALVGALIGGGLVWAYRRALLRQVEEGLEPQATTAVGVSDLARLALGLLGLLRQVAELGR